jgi:uncharacterized protein
MNDIGSIDMAAPIAPVERIISLDVLRGVAVLGILIMNIQSFSMIEAAYLNPSAFGDLTGLNKWVSILSHITADQKFMTIFSILFGAGIVLMTSKVETKGRKSAGVHYRRTFWLFVIGAIHAYLVWHGDILVLYALCSISVFWFRKLSPRKLLIIGLILLSVASMLSLLFGFTMSYWPEEAYQNFAQGWKPGLAAVEEEVAAYGGGWTDQMPHRVKASLGFHTFIFAIWGGWRAGGLMLLGMALFKWGILTAQRSQRFYQTLMGIGFGLGLPIVIMGVIYNYSTGWSPKSMFFGAQFNYWGSILISLAYISAVMLIYFRLAQSKSVELFAKVGRSAFTNYIGATLICTTLFYGHGFGLFGKVERYYQILFVFGVWLVQILFSHLWMSRFKFGPLEWLWRTLTYMKLQPMRLLPIFILGIFMIAGCGDEKSDPIDPGDTIPPGQVTDLFILEVTSSTVLLTWTAPGDDDQEGTASAYDVRYQSDPQVDPWWESATIAASIPVPQTAGSQEMVTITGLESGRRYCFQLRTVDDGANWSVVSNRDCETTP